LILQTAWHIPVLHFVAWEGVGKDTERS
jgi:hypothetical protein